MGELRADLRLSQGPCPRSHAFVVLASGVFQEAVGSHLKCGQPEEHRRSRKSEPSSDIFLPTIGRTTGEKKGR